MAVMRVVSLGFPEYSTSGAIFKDPYIAIVDNKGLRYIEPGYIPWDYTIAINNYGAKPEYYIRDMFNLVNSRRESAISIIQDNYPELFDWLLFHPEWL